jgi:rhodanese-related sulfurtransferase
VVVGEVARWARHAATLARAPGERDTGEDAGMAETARRDSLLELFAETRDVIGEFVASRSAAERQAAAGTSEQWSAGELITAIAFWMDYTVERMEYYARGEPAPRGVDFGAVERQALAERAAWTWDERVAGCTRALDALMAEVRGFTDAQLATENTYDDETGGPLWGEVQANGFIWPLQELEKYTLRVGEAERAAAIRRRLAPVTGEDEPPVVCDLTTPEDLGRLQAAGGVLVIDVRGKADYARGHVRGARHIPLSELARKVERLPKDQPIVTYCNMHHPGHSRGERAAALLAEHGARASAIAGGFPAYEASGLPVERAAPTATGNGG